MNQLFIYIPSGVSAREKYVCDFVFNEYLGLTVNYISERHHIPEERAVINYSRESLSNSLQFIPSGLLAEREIKAPKLKILEFNGYRVLFPVQEKSEAWPFDPLSCVFYMLSRYEEYSDSERDGHGRYRVEESISYKMKQLNRPWIDDILCDIADAISQKFPFLSLRRRQFELLTTYDIDVPYAILGRSKWRLFLSGFKMKMLQSASIKNWFTTILNIEKNTIKDPYDSFDFMNNLDNQFNLNSRYFILVNHRGKYNPSIDHRKPAFKKLIKEKLRNREIGIHPSYATMHDTELLAEEKEMLELLLDRQIKQSRSHFLRTNIPKTWNSLVSMGITDDFSMGYAGCPGFRAGISIAFPAFDLVRNEALELNIHPFCWMDATYRYYRVGLSDKAILEEAKTLIKNLKKVNGRMVTIAHNDNFTSWNDQRDFSSLYESLLRAAFSD